MSGQDGQRGGEGWRGERENVLSFSCCVGGSGVSECTLLCGTLFPTPSFPAPPLGHLLLAWIAFTALVITLSVFQNTLTKLYYIFFMVILLNIGGCAERENGGTALRKMEN